MVPVLGKSLYSDAIILIPGVSTNSIGAKNWLRENNASLAENVNKTNTTLLKSSNIVYAISGEVSK